MKLDFTINGGVAVAGVRGVEGPQFSLDLDTGTVEGDCIGYLDPLNEVVTVEPCDGSEPVQVHLRPLRRFMRKGPQ